MGARSKDITDGEIRESSFAMAAASFVAALITSDRPRTTISTTTTTTTCTFVVVHMETQSIATGRTSGKYPMGVCSFQSLLRLQVLDQTACRRNGFRLPDML
jgi:hypothetical protein